MKKTYIAVVEPGDEATAHGVSFPDLPGIHSAADDEGDILPNASEALQLWAEGEAMPEPSKMQAILQREDVRAALADGSYLLAVPFMPPRKSHDGYLTSNKVLVRFDNISRMTLQRWVRNPDMGFPQPMIIGNRWYFKLSEIEAWEEHHKRKSKLKK